ncbi:MAG: 50S ribosomal protein L21 [Patescibacteria group bacterium]|jgi:large subunit ribosomal protein L21
MANIAVIQTGGKQYLVKEGDTLRVEKLDVQEGAALKFDVLLVTDESGKDTKVGAPFVKGAAVSAKVLGFGRANKVIVVKFHAKARYKRKAGHRQPFTEIKIESIKA